MLFLERGRRGWEVRVTAVLTRGPSLERPQGSWDNGNNLEVRVDRVSAFSQENRQRAPLGPGRGRWVFWKDHLSAQRGDVAQWLWRHSG